MTLKPGQWIVVNPNLPYWPHYHKDKLGPFQIKILHESGKKQWYQLENAPNSVYTKDCTLYTPQVGDKVKILKVMCGMKEGDLYDYTGGIGTITSIHLAGEEPSLSIDGWFYLYKEGETFELVEPKGSINTATPETPSTPVVKPTKRVLNADI